MITRPPDVPKSLGGRIENFASNILNNERRIWIYTPPGYKPEGKPYHLLLLFDGSGYVSLIPAPAVLDNLLAKGLIPPTVAVLVDNGRGEARNRELTCNPQFAEFIAKELLPWVRQRYHVTSDPSETVVGGVSFGGLAAAYVALKHPEIFGNVLAQSGSFWWKPEEEQYLPETLEYICKALSITSCFSEILVVDNDSQDATKRIANSFGAKVFLETEHNIAKVRNTGAKNSNGDILIFIDADTHVPETLFNKITSVMEDGKCYGGAVAVEYGDFERKWMKYYLLGWKFWGRVFNMAQGAAQFCRKPVFERLEGYDQTIFMGEDVEFYWRLSKYARRNNGYLRFVEHPKVKTSTRRFDKMSLWKTFLLTHPIFIRLTWRMESYWKDWYEKAVR